MPGIRIEHDVVRVRLEQLGGSITGLCDQHLDCAPDRVRSRQGVATIIPRIATFRNHFGRPVLPRTHAARTLQVRVRLTAASSGTERDVVDTIAFRWARTLPLGATV